MYCATPFARVSSGSGIAAAGVGGTWMTGLNILHLIVAATSLLALTIAMSKLAPARQRAWAPSPMPRSGAAMHTLSHPRNPSSEA